MKYLCRLVCFNTFAISTYIFFGQVRGIPTWASSPHLLPAELCSQGRTATSLQNRDFWTSEIRVRVTSIHVSLCCFSLLSQCSVMVNDYVDQWSSLYDQLKGNALSSSLAPHLVAAHPPVGDSLCFKARETKGLVSSRFKHMDVFKSRIFEYLSFGADRARWLGQFCWTAAHAKGSRERQRAADG